MPAFIAGLPLHVLVVHAVVVLVPLAVLATITVAAWPATRHRYGWLAVAVTALATAAVPIATSSGGDLRARLPRDPLIAQHAELGDELLIVVAPLLVAVTALMVLDHYRTRRTEGPGAMVTATSTARWARPTTLALAVLTVALAVVSAVQVVRIGESGARAVWSPTHYLPPTTQHSDDG